MAVALMSAAMLAVVAVALVAALGWLVVAWFGCDDDDDDETDCCKEDGSDGDR